MIERQTNTAPAPLLTETEVAQLLLLAEQSHATGWAAVPGGVNGDGRVWRTLVRKGWAERTPFGEPAAYRLNASGARFLSCLRLDDWQGEVEKARGARFLETFYPAHRWPAFAAKVRSAMRSAAER